MSYFIPVDAPTEAGIKIEGSGSGLTWSLIIDPDGIPTDLTPYVDESLKGGDTGQFCRYSATLRNVAGALQAGDFAGDKAEIRFCVDGGTEYVMATLYVSAEGLARTRGAVTEDSLSIALYDYVKNKATNHLPEAAILAGLDIVDTGSTGNSILHTLAGYIGVTDLDTEDIEETVTIASIGTRVPWTELKDVASLYHADMYFRYDGELRFYSPWQSGYSEVSEWTWITPEVSVSYDQYAFKGQKESVVARTCNRCYCEWTDYEELEEQDIYRNFDSYNEDTARINIVVESGEYYPGGSEAGQALRMSYMNPVSGESYPIATDVNTPEIAIDPGVYNIDNNRNRTALDTEILCVGGLLDIVSFNGSTAATQSSNEYSEIILKNNTSNDIIISKLVLIGTPYQISKDQTVEDIDATVVNDYDYVDKTLPGKFASDYDQVAESTERTVENEKGERLYFIYGCDFNPLVQRGAYITFHDANYDKLCKVVSYAHDMPNSYQRGVTTLQVTEWGTFTSTRTPKQADLDAASASVAPKISIAAAETPVYLLNAGDVQTDQAEFQNAMWPMTQEGDTDTARDLSGQGNDVALTAGYFESVQLPDKGIVTYLKGGVGTLPTLDDNVQTIVGIDWAGWWASKVAASYQFLRGFEMKDSGVGGHDLTENGSPTYGAGSWGLRGITFDSSNPDYLSLDDAFFSPGSDSFSLIIVYKTSNSTDNEALFSQGDSSNNNRIAVRMNATELQGNLVDDSGNAITPVLVTSANNPNDGNVHVLGITINRDSDECIGFFDGVEKTTTDITTLTDSIVNTDASMQIGARTSTTQLFDGTIYTVIPIYEALSEDDHSNYYNLLTGATQRTEDTKILGPADGNHSAYFGDYYNLIYDQVNIKDWVAGAGASTAAFNDNYKGKPLAKITRLSSTVSYILPTAVTIGNTYLYSSVIVKRGTATGFDWYVRNTIAAINDNTFTINLDDETMVLNTGTAEDYGIEPTDEDDVFLVWAITSGHTSGNTYRVYFNNITDADDEYFYAGLPVLYDGNKKVPYNELSVAGTVHNETDIPVGLFLEDEITTIMRLDDYDTGEACREYEWYSDASNIVRLQHNISASNIRAVWIESGTSAIITSGTITSAYYHDYVKCVFKFSITNPNLTIYYGYDPDTETSAGSATITEWDISVTGRDTTQFNDVNMNIGISGVDTQQMNGMILSVIKDSPDNSENYFKRQYNRPWGDCVEKPSLWNGVSAMRHLQACSVFQQETVLDLLTQTPGQFYSKGGAESLTALSQAFDGDQRILDFCNAIGAGSYVESLAANTLFAETLAVVTAFIENLYVKYLDAASGTLGALSVLIIFSGEKAFTTSDDAVDVYDWFVGESGGSYSSGEYEMFVVVGTYNGTLTKFAIGKTSGGDKYISIDGDEYEDTDTLTYAMTITKVFDNTKSKSHIVPDEDSYWLDETGQDLGGIGKIWRTIRGSMIIIANTSTVSSASATLYTDKTIGYAIADLVGSASLTGYKINGVQVVGQQQSAIADADGSLSSVTAQFNDLLDNLRAHGLIDT